MQSHKQESANQSPDDFIFCREEGEPLCYPIILHRLYDAMDAAGIKREKSKHGFHLFRHSLATEMYRNTRGIKDVQLLLRHANISTTGDIYVHPEDEISSEGIGVFADEILSNRDLLVTEESNLVS